MSEASPATDLGLTDTADELTPTAAWSRRVRRIGGLIQAAFAAFWLLRGSLVIGGGVADALIAVSAVSVIGAFSYAIRATAGTAPRPKSAEGKRIERGVTLATVIELVAAFVLPIIVSAAGHSDWVLPSIAITIGPLLLWLDHRVHIPRYRPVGWALTDRPRDPRRDDVRHSADRHHGHRRRRPPARHRRRRLPRPRGRSTPSGTGRQERPRGRSEHVSAAMSEDRLHVVFGAGQVGRALSARLVAHGLPVRVVSRNRPVALADGVEWQAADASASDTATDAAKGASVLYQCLNAPYTNWPQRFPPLQQGVLAAAEHNGALLVSLENIYGYGQTGGKPMTEDLPLLATTVKGRTRAAMTHELLTAADAGRVRIAIGRASDFFGAGVTETTLGERVFGNAVAGKRADFLGNPDLPHTYSYVPDIAAGLAILGTDERAADGVWHLPGPETVTTRQALELIAGEVGHPVAIRSIPKLVMRALGLFDPMLRELAEMSYQFEQPFVLDTTKYQSTFGTVGTPLATAIASTVAWYRSRNGTPNTPQEGPISWPAQTPSSPPPQTLRTASAQTTAPGSEPSPIPPPASGSGSRPSPRTATKT